MMYRVIGGFYGFAFYGILLFLSKCFVYERTVKPFSDVTVGPGALRTRFIIEDLTIYILIGKKKGFAAVHTEDTPFDWGFAAR